MDKMIVVLDDAEFALQQLLPMRVNGVATCWMLVACPPRLTRHASRWVSRSAREAWRAKWSQDLLDKVEAVLLSSPKACSATWGRLACSMPAVPSWATTRRLPPRANPCPATAV